MAGFSCLQVLRFDSRFLHELRQLRHAAHQIVVILRRQGLRAVGKGLGRVRVHFHDQAVRAAGDGSEGHRLDEAPFAGAVARVHDNRQVRKVLDGGDGGKVEGVPRIGLVGADAALTENDVRIAFVQDVFGGVQPLVEGGGEAALQHDGLLGAADFLQQAEILHIAGADLQKVGILGDGLDGIDLGDFGDDAQAGLFFRLGKIFEAFFLQPLEGIRRGAGLVGAAAQELGAALFRDLGGGKELLAALDGAGARHDHEFIAAHRHAVHVDNAGLWMELTAGQLVALRDRDAALDPRQCVDGAGAEARLVADDADNALLGAFHDFRGKPRALDHFDDVLDVFCGSVGIHDDNHKLFSPYYNYICFYQLAFPSRGRGTALRWMRCSFKACDCFYLFVVPPHPSAFGCHLPLEGKADYLLFFKHREPTQIFEPDALFPHGLYGFFQRLS